MRAKVLDALQDPENGYYDPRDPYTTVPRSSVLAAAMPRMPPGAGTLRGLRIGVIRESMLLRSRRQVGRADLTAAAAEIKAVLRDSSARRWWNPATAAGSATPTSSR